MKYMAMYVHANQYTYRNKRTDTQLQTDTEAAMQMHESCIVAPCLRLLLLSVWHVSSACVCLVCVQSKGKAPAAATTQPQHQDKH